MNFLVTIQPFDKKYGSDIVEREMTIFELFS